MDNSLSPVELAAPGVTSLSGVPEGFDALVLADLARQRAASANGLALIHIARDDQRLSALAAALRFFAPEIEVLTFPAWDCLPYDRVSPSPALVSQRFATLAMLASRAGEGGQDARERAPAVLLTTVNAAMQRLVPREVVRSQQRVIHPGNRIDLAEFAGWLSAHGYERSSMVRDPASFAVRGGIVDLFPAAAEQPVRLDFFGDTVESIRSFDAETQRSTAQLTELALIPVNEAVLTEETIRSFRSGYRQAFGTVTGEDPLYEAVSEGRQAVGMEHWLPLFYPRLETVFDYAPDAAVSLDHLADEAHGERMEQVEDYYQARHQARAGTAARGDGAPAYKPLPPGALYLTAADWESALGARARVQFEAFDEGAAGAGKTASLNMGGRNGRIFAAERASADVNVFEAVAAHARALQGAGKRVAIACWSTGSAARMGQMLADHGLADTATAATWPLARELPQGTLPIVELGLERGFEAEKLAFISEQDILGDRLARPRRKSRRAADFLTEATSLSAGDIVVHVDHGIGRFTGLRTIEAAGAPHDCLEMVYAGGDKLFLPVENIELLSRYGSEDTEVQLDRLGGASWQARKARAKKRIMEMAGELIEIAAARALRHAPAIEAPDGSFDEFCARFPYEDTEDQQSATETVLADLASGRPMDRLICGDVGFGKTEVALRAAFVAAISGRQVAVVVPTTLLARQHYRTFTERFRGFPVKIGQASRLVSAKELAETKKGLASGDIDIVIGTHALLGKSVKFRDLVLLIVDEEQHFGVVHKERLKQLRAELHVLTLTATPIPRTLQQALGGIRELSLIATPPVDRLAVRTFISPFDPIVVREALLREHYRGGQTFYVCPRIADLPEAESFLREHVPEVKFAIAHGQMAPGQLDDIMSAFYDGKFDVLLSTTIVESGLDVASANTLIVHRADRFGLAQLYQLRGRVGRSKRRAYALLTLPANGRMTPSAERRLKVLQSLDTLGAGFQLASHDLDIRGGGNLLGEEQSGHIREVGFELYQSMLEEAVAELRAGGGEGQGKGQWSPQIALGAAILLPESFVADLDLRLGLYRRLSMMEDEAELESFAAELIDRFGPLPGEVRQLLKVVAIKMLCRKANIEKLDAGPRGMVAAFRSNSFPNPEGLIGFIADQGSHAKVRPDHSLVLVRDWADTEARMKGVDGLVRQMAAIAATADKEKNPAGAPR
ncbi:MAG TPA: transcription-repair coupling factor [Hyphomicrobiales bacterium]|nr:transcription-repair coupling factor [Hyphomicrobiales bacterium]